ncbi:MAG: YbhB/YbcL family Raf kinase inhibitor-like protein [archaeon]
MKNYFILLIIIIFFSSCVKITKIEPQSSAVLETHVTITPLMRISSPAFQNGTQIPSKYTCDGNNINPALNIEKIPLGTKSLVLIVDDPDVQAGVWTHWVLYNIPIDVNITENTIVGLKGKNSWGNTLYRGPCPPSGTHRYFFKLYAVDKELAFSEPPTKNLILSAINGHVIETAELTGTYSKNLK